MTLYQIGRGCVVEGFSKRPIKNTKDLHLNSNTRLRPLIVYTFDVKSMYTLDKHVGSMVEF